MYWGWVSIYSEKLTSLTWRRWRAIFKRLGRAAVVGREGQHISRAVQPVGSPYLVCISLTPWTWQFCWWYVMVSNLLPPEGYVLTSALNNHDASSMYFRFHVFGKQRSKVWTLSFWEGVEAGEEKLRWKILCRPRGPISSGDHGSENTQMNRTRLSNASLKVTWELMPHTTIAMN